MKIATFCLIYDARKIHLATSFRFDLFSNGTWKMIVEEIVILMCFRKDTMYYLMLYNFIIMIEANKSNKWKRKKRLVVVVDTIQCDQTFFSEPAQRSLNSAQIARTSQKFGLFLWKNYVIFSFYIVTRLTNKFACTRVLKSAQVGRNSPTLVTLTQSSLFSRPYNCTQVFTYSAIYERATLSCNQPLTRIKKDSSKLIPKREFLFTAGSVVGYMMPIEGAVCL